MSTTPVSNAPAREETASNDVLVHPGWLEAHLHDPSVRVIEVDVSRAAYDRWHIDGAVLWNVYADLKDPGYQLVSTPAVRRLFQRSGITPDTTVVFYGYAPALGLWLMKLYGHPDVRILDCSRPPVRRYSFGKRTGPATPFPRRRGWLSEVTFMFTFAAMFFLVVLFPDGRSRWRVPRRER